MKYRASRCSVAAPPWAGVMHNVMPARPVAPWVGAASGPANPTAPFPIGLIFWAASDAVGEGKLAFMLKFRNLDGLHIVACPPAGLTATLARPGARATALEVRHDTTPFDGVLRHGGFLSWGAQGMMAIMRIVGRVLVYAASL